MSETSTPPRLADRIRSQRDRDRERRKRAEEVHLRHFDAKLSASVNVALNGMSDATDRLNRASAALSQTSSRMLRSFWLPALAAGLSLSIGICGGAWGLTHYLSSLILEKAELIEEQRRSLEQLERGSAGLTLQRDPEGRAFLAGPPGTILTPASTSDGRPAWIIND